MKLFAYSLIALLAFIPSLFSIVQTYNQNIAYSHPAIVVKDGVSYVSVQNVPAGTTITSTDYWTPLLNTAPDTEPGDPPASEPDIADSDLSNLTEPEDTNTTVTASGLSSASNEAFVMQQYLDFFGRDADESGLNWWTGELDAGRKERADLAMDFVYSDEYQDNVAPVVRLYFAYFNRLPDTGGLTFWIEAYINPENWTLYQISDSFATSDEFIATYGNLDNGPYVTLTYNNVFEREPDSGGYTFWKNELDTGNRSRGMAMVEHAESQEYKDKMSSEVQIVAYYFSLLRRAPDQGGFDYWVGRLKNGDSAKSLIADFLYSDEYQGRDFTLTH